MGTKSYEPENIGIQMEMAAFVGSEANCFCESRRGKGYEKIRSSCEAHAACNVPSKAVELMELEELIDRISLYTRLAVNTVNVKRFPDSSLQRKSERRKANLKEVSTRQPPGLKRGFPKRNKS